MKPSDELNVGQFFCSLLHREQVVSKDELLDKLWPDQVVTETALTRCIVAARKAGLK